MRDPLSNTVKEIKPSGIRKFFDVVSEMKDAISLGVGEPDFDTPWHIREEGIYSLEKGRTFYTSNAGLKELRVEICNYLQRRLGLEYHFNDEIIVTVGGSEAIDLAIRAMIDPGDEVLVPQPSFVSYIPCVQLAYGKPVPIELKEENNLLKTSLDTLQKLFDKLIKFLKDRMFNKKEKDKYYDFSVDLYTHGIINDKEIKDIKDNYDYSKEKESKNKNDDFEL